MTTRNPEEQGTPRIRPTPGPDGLRCLESVRAWLEREASATARPIVVGIGGPGGSGKSTVARWLQERIPGSRLLGLDDFRLPRPLRPPRARFGSHPDANDLPRVRQALLAFREGRPFGQPVFDTASGQPVRTDLLPPGRLLLADGEIAAHARVRAWLDRLILVEAHWRTQLQTRLTRDVRERRVPLDKAIDIFLRSNLRDYPRFSRGAPEEADIVLYCTARRSFSIRRTNGLGPPTGVG